MVVIDNAHKLFANNNKPSKFLDKLTDEEWVILLASQLPPQNSDFMKNQNNLFCLTELPHEEAVDQIENCFEIQNSRLAQVTPPLQANYFAYRMWFYIGGNLRFLRTKILAKDFATHKNNFGKDI